MDYSVGMLVSTAMLAGLYWRDTVSNLGNYFECSQVQGSTRYTEYGLPLWGRTGIVRMRWGNWDTEICVNGICACGLSSYPHSDHPAEKEEGYIYVGAYTDEDFGKLMNLIGRPDLAKKFASHDDRVEAKAQEEIYPAIEEFLKDKNKEEAARIFIWGRHRQPAPAHHPGSGQLRALPGAGLPGLVRRPVLRRRLHSENHVQDERDPAAVEARASSGRLRQRRDLPAGLRPQPGSDPGV